MILDSEAYTIPECHRHRQHHYFLLYMFHQRMVVALLEEREGWHRCRISRSLPVIEMDPPKWSYDVPRRASPRRRCSWGWNKNEKTASQHTSGHYLCKHRVMLQFLPREATNESKWVRRWSTIDLPHAKRWITSPKGYPPYSKRRQHNMRCLLDRPSSCWWPQVRMWVLTRRKNKTKRKNKRHVGLFGRVSNQLPRKTIDDDAYVLIGSIDLFVMMVKCQLCSTCPFHICVERYRTPRERPFRNGLYLSFLMHRTVCNNTTTVWKNDAIQREALIYRNRAKHVTHLYESTDKEKKTKLQLFGIEQEKSTIERLVGEAWWLSTKPR